MTAPVPWTMRGDPAELRQAALDTLRATMPARLPTQVHMCARIDCPNEAAVQWARQAPAEDDPDSTEPVYACTDHGIDGELAACVHQASCPGPNSTALPQCGCTPIQPEPSSPPTPPDLPAGW